MMTKIQFNKSHFSNDFVSKQFQLLIDQVIIQRVFKMCGIAGIYSKNRPIEVLNKIAKNMANTILHRGPDDSDFWIDSNHNLIF